MRDLSSVTDKGAKIFLLQYLASREINIEFYKRVPQDKLDFRIVDNPERKSDSIRESLEHQMRVQMDYQTALDTGKLEFNARDNREVRSLNKEGLLGKLAKLDEELLNKLSDPKVVGKMVSVPWSKEPIPAIAMLYGMNSHEILHTGWNLALMDLLDIERFPALKQMWG